MFRLILIISSSLILSDSVTSSVDLFEFQNKIYLANSYNVFSGDVIDYYPSGTIKLEGVISKGIKVGIWYEYYDSGKIKSKTNHDLDQIFITHYYKNQSIKSSGLLYKNKPSGLWINFDKSGNEILHSYYTDGILDSVKEMDFNNVENIFQLDDKNIPDIIDLNKENPLSPNLSILDTMSLIKNGKYTQYFDSGMYLVEHYSENILNGKYTLFFDNGRKYIERTIVNGNVDTLTLQYDNLGLLVAQYYEFIDSNRRIFKNGDYTSFHFNGEIKEKGLFVSGYRYGIWEEFNDSGIKIKEVSYKVDPLDLNQKSIKGKIINYDAAGNRTTEYETDIFLDCPVNHNDCNSLFGKQHNIEVKNGLFQTFYTNGDLKSEGMYLDNSKVGDWYEYYNTGSMYSMTNYNNNIGVFTSYFDLSNHNLIASDSSRKVVLKSGFILNDKYNGHWKQYNLSGELIKEYYMSNDQVDVNYPVQTFYQSDDLDKTSNNYKNKLKEEYYCIGAIEDCKFDGLYKQFYMNGGIKKIGVYQNNLKYDKWNYYYENKKIKKELMFDDYGNGYHKSYYNTGELLNLGSYKNYMKEGKWVYYYLDGHIEWVIFYLNDTINPNQLCSNWHESGYKKNEGYLLSFDNEVLWDGKYIEYFDNGIIFQEGYFSNGLKNGKWIEYYTNRIRKNEGYYVSGAQLGEWNYYSRDGSLINKKTYDE